MKSWLLFLRSMITLFVVFCLLVSCNKEYSSSYGYDHIKVYEYNKKPWGSDASKNKLYLSEVSVQDRILYPKIGKLNFTLIDSLKPSQKIDSILFKGKYEEYFPRPNCPAGNNHILLFYKEDILKYVAKFSDYCDECFLINHSTGQRHYMKLGYNDFMKQVKTIMH